MLEQLHARTAEVQDLDRYLADFQHHFWANDISWKLERQTTFEEPGVPSWVAMARGDWDTALRLIDEMREPRKEYQRRLDATGITQRRVRIVSDPVTPYLQWELHALRVWAELGEEIRVLPASAVRHLESAGELPEIVVLGGETAAEPVMFEIGYARNVLAGARKFEDPELVGGCRREIAALWAEGENLFDYFDREVAWLSPPRPQAVSRAI